MRHLGTLVVIALLGAACGGDDDAPPADAASGGPDGASAGDAGAPDAGAADASPAGTFDEELGPFIEATCTAEAMCFGGNMMMCTNDVTMDMNDARDALDAAGEMRCAACMHAKTVELQELIAAACDTTVIDEEAVFAACDLDPNVDFDGDGTANNDDDEACAGFP